MNRYLSQLLGLTLACGLTVSFASAQPGGIGGGDPPAGGGGAAAPEPAPELPPIIVKVDFTIFDQSGNLVFRGFVENDPNSEGFSPALFVELGVPNQLLLERYRLGVVLTFQDPQLVEAKSETDPNGETTITYERKEEDIYARKLSYGLSPCDAFVFFSLRTLGSIPTTIGLTSPSPPPLDASEPANFVTPPGLFIPPISDDPNVPKDQGTVTYFYVMPRFNGANQQRLAGNVACDVGYLTVIALSNDQSPSEEQLSALSYLGLFLRVRQNPSLRPADSPPIADASGSPGTAFYNPETGTARFVLSAASSYDASNVGFDPFDPNVYEKNNLIYTWELINWPANWTPDFSIDPLSIGSPQSLCELKNVQPGQEFEFRVIVFDGVNPTPSTSTAFVRIEPPPPPNNRPIANAGPDKTVAVNAIVTLDGSASTDVEDGTNLSYLWRQVNAVGGELELDQLSKAFQPISGTTAARSNWRAVTPGTYYFRLAVVDSGGLSDIDFVTVVVTSTAAGGATQSDVKSTAPPTTTGEGLASPMWLPFNLCGFGLLPVVLVPPVLLALRGRRW